MELTHYQKIKTTHWKSRSSNLKWPFTTYKDVTRTVLYSMKAMAIPTDPTVLGHPWLKTHNPIWIGSRINWLLAPISLRHINPASPITLRQIVVSPLQDINVRTKSSSQAQWFLLVFSSILPFSLCLCLPLISQHPSSSTNLPSTSKLSRHLCRRTTRGGGLPPHNCWYWSSFCKAYM